MNNQMWYYPFRHTFVSSIEENMIVNWEIINVCNVSIEKEQKIIFVKNVSFLLRTRIFKAEFQKLLFFDGIFFVSQYSYNILYCPICCDLLFLFLMYQTLCCVEQRKRKEHHLLEVKILKRNEYDFWLLNHFSW